MNKVLRILLLFVGALVLAIAGLLTYIKMVFPDVGPAPEVKVKRHLQGAFMDCYLSLAGSGSQCCAFHI